MERSKHEGRRKEKKQDRPRGSENRKCSAIALSNVFVVCECVRVCVVGALVCVVSDVSASEAALEEGWGWWGGGVQPSRQRQHPVKNRVRQNK